jgi:hypothetical protein
VGVGSAGVRGGRNRRVWLGPEGAFPTWMRVSASLIRTILEEAGTRLPTLLLGSEPRQLFIGHFCVSLKTAPAPNHH